MTNQTILVEGIERPTHNSEGRLIHRTEQGIINFWRWFGKSKVVDSQGRPLVVYHAGTVEPDVDIANTPMHFGTKRAAEDRAAVFAGTQTLRELAQEMSEDEDGWWVIDEGPFASREEAAEYIIDIANRSCDYQEEAPPIHAFYLRILKPSKEQDASLYAPKIGDEEYDPDADDWDDVLENIPTRCDGVMYLNAFEGKGSISWIALDPLQIKSAEHNSGNFSPSDDLMSNPRRRRRRK